MRAWTFENDSGRTPQMKYVRYYVEYWEEMKADNTGYLLWGGVGIGKSNLAGCIANALMEKEISVCMTNFSAILNDLKSGFDDKNAYIGQLCRYPLLIITTNLTLQELQNPEDTAHSRIYDRVLEMCVPIHFSGESYRKETAQNKLERLKEVLNGKESL